VVKVKVKFTLEQAMKAGEGKFGSTLSLTSVLDGGGWSMPCPGRWERDLVPTYWRLGGPQGWSGRVQNILLPPEFEP